MTAFTALLEIRALARWLEMAGAPSPLITVGMTSNEQATPTLNVGICKVPLLAYYTIPIDRPASTWHDICEEAKVQWEEIKAGRRMIQTALGPRLWAEIYEMDRTLASILEKETLK